MTIKQDNPHLLHLKLGEKTEYISHYQPSLLQAVPRQLNRDELGVNGDEYFKGVDVWHAYEMSWLNHKGKPVVALGRFTFEASNPNIVESKSFKLYLNSFNQTSFETQDELVKFLTDDLSNISQGPVKVELFTPEQAQAFPNTTLPGTCIDDLDIEIKDFSFKADYLQNLNTSTAPSVKETLHSHLLKSNCLITNQPDWASLVITYEGPQINEEQLLRYVISFREHNEFHEQCVERIYNDIDKAYQPSKLSVQALYTRRGGLDINPFRSSDAKEAAPRFRINRQ